MADKPKTAARPMGRVKRTPQDLAAYFYNQKRMHMVCFFSSLAMLLSFMWMIWADYDREWKEYQRAYLAIDLALVQLNIDREEALLAAKKGKMKEREEKIKAAQADLDADQKYIDAKKRIEETKAEHYNKNLTMKFADSEQKAARSKYELAKTDYEAAQIETNPKHKRLHEHKKHVEDAEEKLKEADQALSDAEIAYDEIDAQVTGFKKFIEDTEKPREDLLSEKKKLLDEKEKLERRLEHERPRLATAIRNAPMLDFFGPQQKVKQVVLPNVQDDIHFELVIEKVDRCHTCHLAIGDPTWAAERDLDADAGLGEVYHFKDPIKRKLVEPEWESDDPELKTQVVMDFLASEDVAALRKSYFGNFDDQQKYTKAFMAHPYPEVYVTSNSSHPIEKFGCTVCHEGDGRDTEFSRVVHTPENAFEKATWERRHDYHLRHLWDHPMLPSKFVYASCRKCHSAEVEIRTAKPYNDGMILFERAGCYGCHKTEGYTILDKDVPRLPVTGEPDDSKRTRRPGPPLTHIADKASKDWAFNWVLRPRAFRRTTRMPHFFGQSNARRVVFRSMEPDDAVIDEASEGEVEDVLAAVMVDYLFGISQERDPTMQGGAGDPVKGEYIFDSVGCIGCHTVTTNAQYDEELRQIRVKGEKKSHRLKEFAPSLAAIGGKVDPGWLFQWLKNPHATFKDTRMPNLRLSDDEARHLTAYLMSLRDPDWDDRVAGHPFPDLESPRAQGIIQHLMREIETKRNSLVTTKAKITKMTGEERVRWLGDRMVQNYGCYGCHEIHDPAKGEKEQWTKLEGIGVELTGTQPFGSKFLDRIDWGDTKYDGVHYHGITFDHPFVNELAEPARIEKRIPETRHDWLMEKLLDPRVFDAGKLLAKPPDELLRMPNFGFNPYEAGLLTTYVISFTDHEGLGLMDLVKKVLTKRESAVNRGRRILREHNCAGCHRLSASRMKIAYRPGGEGTKLITRWFTADAAWLNDYDLEEYNDDLEEDIEWTWPGEKPEAVDAVYRATWLANHITLKRPGLDDTPDRRVPRLAVLEFVPGEGGDIVPTLIKAKEAIYPGDDKVGLLVPPWLRTQGHKTRPEWLFEFLKTPVEIRPNLWRPIAPNGPYKGEVDIQVRMGDFDLTDEEAASLVKYFVAVDQTDELESAPERDPAFVAAWRPKLDAVMKLVNGDCVSCHVYADKPPPGTVDQLKWAPEILNAARRLRPRWLYAWHENPASIYPDTIMTIISWNPAMSPIENDEELQKLIPQTMLNIKVLRESPKEE